MSIVEMKTLKIISIFTGGMMLGVFAANPKLGESRLDKIPPFPV